MRTNNVWIAKKDYSQIDDCEVNHEKVAFFALVQKVEDQISVDKERNQSFLKYGKLF